MRKLLGPSSAALRASPPCRLVRVFIQPSVLLLLPGTPVSPVVLGVKVGPCGVWVTCGGDRGQHAFFPQGHQWLQRRVQAKGGVQCQGGLVTAIGCGQGNGGEQDVIVFVAMGLQRGQAVIGPRMSFVNVFRHEVIKQPRGHLLALGCVVDAMAYLQFTPPFGDDRYVVEGKYGNVDVTFSGFMEK